MTPSTPAGDVVRDDDGVTLVFVREHAVTVAEMWAAVTEPDRLARWFGRWTGDPATGTVQLTMTGEGDAASPEPVTIDACEPPRRLAVTSGGAGARWPLEVTLAEHAGGVVLRFTHRLTSADDAPSIGAGWHYYLDRLGAVVAGLPPTEDWDDYFPALAEAYRVPPSQDGADDGAGDGGRVGG